MAPTSTLLKGKAALRTPAGHSAIRCSQSDRVRLAAFPWEVRVVLSRWGRCPLGVGAEWSSGIHGLPTSASALLVGEGPHRPPSSDLAFRAGPAPSLRAGFRGTAPEGRGLGFGFLQMRQQQGNRGVSGNHAGSAEVRQRQPGVGWDL